MTNVKYSRVLDTARLVRLLCVQKKTIPEVCQILSDDPDNPVPYNCVMQQIRMKFTDEQKSQVVSARRHYSRAEKIQILKEASAEKKSSGKMSRTSEKYSVQPHQMRAWHKRLSAEKAAREAAKS